MKPQPPLIFVGLQNAATPQSAALRQRSVGGVVFLGHDGLPA
jgi:hypothetical protein